MWICESKRALHEYDDFENTLLKSSPNSVIRPIISQKNLNVFKNGVTFTTCKLLLSETRWTQWPGVVDSCIGSQRRVKCKHKITKLTKGLCLAHSENPVWDSTQAHSNIYSCAMMDQDYFGFALIPPQKKNPESKEIVCFIFSSCKTTKQYIRSQAVNVPWMMILNWI